MGGGMWATFSFRERHGHVAARDAEVVRRVGPVVVGAVALCGRGGEGEEGGRRGGGPGRGGRRRRPERRRRRPEARRRRVAAREVVLLAEVRPRRAPRDEELRPVLQSCHPAARWPRGFVCSLASPKCLERGNGTDFRGWHSRQMRHKTPQTKPDGDTDDCAPRP